MPVSVTRLADGRQIVDLGPEHQRLGPPDQPRARPGTTITLTHGEWLDADGDVTDRPPPPDRAVPARTRCRPARSTGSCPSGVPGEVFEPRHTTHGFQYVRIEGHPDELTADDVRGVVVHTDLRRTGWFACSDDRLNRFHEAAVWSFRDNACDIPTDCPHRERAGWTGDWQLFVPTAAFLYDVAGFSTKWLRDVAVDQWPDGTVANISPTPRDEGREGPIAFLNGSAGWGDAAVIVPWEIYRAYGDVAGARRAVADDGPLARPRRADGPGQRHPARVARRPGAGAARAVPVGHRLPLGRVAGARRGDPVRLRRRSSPPTRATSPPPTSRTAPA